MLPNLSERLGSAAVAAVFSGLLLDSPRDGRREQTLFEKLLKKILKNRTSDATKIRLNLNPIFESYDLNIRLLNPILISMFSPGEKHVKESGIRNHIKSYWT